MKKNDLALAVVGGVVLVVLLIAAALEPLN